MYPGFRTTQQPGLVRTFLRLESEQLLPGNFVGHPIEERQRERGTHHFARHGQQHRERRLINQFAVIRIRN